MLRVPDILGLGAILLGAGCGSVQAAGAADEVRYDFDEGLMEAARTSDLNPGPPTSRSASTS
jgi:hypothetical protein